MADDKLEKSSKNARQYKVKGDDYNAAHRRIMQYIKAAGFRAREGSQDRFGVDKDQRGLTWNRNVGRQADHELAHAIMTPVGEGLREHQQKLGFASKQQHQGMTHEQAQAEEMAAFHMQNPIARRAGVRPSGQRSDPTGVGHGNLSDFEHGIKTVDAKGNMVAGTSVDAKINARALNQKNETMTDDIKKAGPPRLPPDALTPPPASARDVMPSPFDNDAIASAPPPAPARGALTPSMWMDRSRFPMVKPEHSEELEQLAAVNEFGRRMPREQAEAEAYAHYRDKQHNEAAVHHLRGQRIAEAAGDKESARKHSLMYGLHTKALGREPVGPVHPDVKAGMAAPSRMYRYKAHGGDMLALAPHVTEHGAVASAPAPTPPLGKAEVDALLVLRKACEVLRKGDVVQFPGNPAPAVDQGAEAPVTSIASDPREKRKVGSAYGFDKYDYSDHLPPEHQQRGMKLHVFHDPQRGTVHGSLVNSGGAIVATQERLGPENYRSTGANLNPSTQDAIANAIDSHLGENGFDAKPRAQGPATGETPESPGSTDELLAQHVGSRALDNHEDREAVRQHLVAHHGLDERAARQLVSRHNHISLDDPDDRHFFASAIDREKAGPLGKKEKEKDDKEMERRSKSEREKNATTCVDCGGYKPHWAQRCLGCYKEREGLGKAEKLIHKGGICRCDAYKFPHRANSHPKRPCK